MNDTVTYRFKFPIKHQNREIAEIAVRPATIADLKALDGIAGDAVRAAKAIELLTGLTAREVEQIRLEDGAGLGEIVGNFFAAWRVAATS
ncbi:MAG: phage tail assembly protein [Rhodospirillales bacterium]|nr:phage tail assembly protein [Rhodospirillales bacterium]